MAELSGNACDRCGAMLLDAQTSLAVYECPTCYLRFDAHLNRVK